MDIFKNGEIIEETIQKIIENLQENKFLVDYEVITKYTRETNLTLEEIADMIMNLRKKKIAFYEAILKEYQKNRQEYDTRLG